MLGKAWRSVAFEASLYRPAIHLMSWTAPSWCFASQRTPFGTLDAESGCRPPHQNCMLVYSMKLLSAHLSQRILDASVDMLDLAALGFDVVPEPTGRPGYRPAAMLKIYLYGYLNQVQ